MVTAKLRSGRKHGEHCRPNGGNCIHDGAGFRARRNRSGSAFLRVPLEWIEPPAALLECVVAGLVDGRWTLKHAGVEQDLGFAANDLVVLFDCLEAGNRPWIEYGALPSLR